jgi:ribosomal protein S18 acetylase RimI-like enzyme
MMNVTIREAKDQDLQLVRKYTLETGWTSISESERIELDKEEWTEHMLGLFEKLSKRETDTIFVAENKNHVFVGYLWVGEGNNMITGKNCGYVYDIFVRKEFRGNGIGKTLLEEAVSFCREKRYSRILLMVSANNEAAKRLYAKMGFQTEQIHMGKVLN